MYSVRVSRQGEFLYDLDFDRNQLIVGRSQESDVMLPHGTVSRRHACIYKREGRLYVVDLGSSNGTYVNGRPVQGELLLNRGDVVYCGIFSLEPFPKAASSHVDPNVPATVQTRAAAPPSAESPPSAPRQDAAPSSRPRVSSTEKTVAPGSLNLAELHAEMARRGLRSVAAPDAVTDPGPPPRHARADEDDARARREREKEREGADREREREREAREREDRERERERERGERERVTRERERSRERERESSAPRRDPRLVPGPDDPTHRAVPPGPPPHPPGPPAAPSWGRGANVPPPPIPPPTFSEMVGPSVLHGPSDD